MPRTRLIRAVKEPGESIGRYRYLRPMIYERGAWRKDRVDRSRYDCNSNQGGEEKIRKRHCELVRWVRMLVPNLHRCSDGRFFRKPARKTKGREGASADLLGQINDEGTACLWSFSWLISQQTAGFDVEIGRRWRWMEILSTSGKSILSYRGTTPGLNREYPFISEAPPSHK